MVRLNHFLHLLAILGTALAISKLPGQSNGVPKPCKLRSYSSGDVCVCDEAYCDSVPQVGEIESGTAKVFTSTSLGGRLQESILKWQKTSSSMGGSRGGNSEESGTKLNVDASQTFQTVMGFGGAFTDASGINIAALKGTLADEVIKQYFGDQGLRYTIGRVPIASCDFSTREYSYDDTDGDLSLVNFKLAPEDYKYKIPFIKQAQSLSSQGLKLFGSPWSAPAWMKTNGKMNGNGTLIGVPGGKYYSTWANYILRFLDSYGMENIRFWGLTAQNEPTTGFVYNYAFQTMGFTPETQRDFIKMDLGPALQNSKHKDIKLMILDDQRVMLPQWAKIVLKDEEAAKYVSGIALHWYYDRLVPPGVLDATHAALPSHFLLSTEACTGALPPPLEFHRGPVMGSWLRAERYASDIIQNLNHWVTGWVDWNLALSEEGGPNWVKNVVDSPIIVNSTGKEFYKQPMFYAIAHFSSYIDVGAQRTALDTTNLGSGIDVLSVKNSNNQRVLVILNSGINAKTIEITDAEKPGLSLQLPIKAHAISTVIWNK